MYSQLKEINCGSYRSTGLTMKFKQDEIIFLFGAGISADAGIPTSTKMIKEVEELVKTDNRWSAYKDLYFLIKSGIEFSYGIQGKEPLFNIEILLNTLNELEKKEMHPLYPFIGSWNIRFNEVIGNEFDLIKNFREDIIEKLKQWMQPQNFKESEYLKKIKNIRNDINFPIRIFTLNYDLLLEKNLKNSKLNIEMGFDEERKWNYKKFTEFPHEPDIYLYKLHGSIDWQRDEKTQTVSQVDNTPQNPDLIFGIQYKMQYIDPYLFMISEFRYYCLNTKLIVCLGYSFSDEHINSIISQANLMDKSKKIFALAYNEEPERIKKIISNENAMVEVNINAKNFFEKELNLKKFIELFPNDIDIEFYFE